MNHIPNLPGGVDLAKLPVPKTHHQTFFQGCNMSFVAVVDEDQIVRAYQMQITDPGENHVYIFGINRTQEKDKMLEDIAALPDIGFSAREVQ